MENRILYTYPEDTPVVDDINKGRRHMMPKPIKYIISDNDCWVCVSHAHDKQGYPKKYYNGITTSISRIILQLEDPQPKDHKFQALHSCDNPTCINPAHLRWGTVQDNINDMIERGRQPNRQGENCGGSKLTEEEVRAIRAMYATGNHSYVKIAEIFNSSESNIGSIVTRVSWAHVD